MTEKYCPGLEYYFYNLIDQMEKSSDRYGNVSPFLLEKFVTVTNTLIKNAEEKNRKEVEHIVARAFSALTKTKETVEQAHEFSRNNTLKAMLAIYDRKELWEQPSEKENHND
jgi:hypothetical protein